MPDIVRGNLPTQIPVQRQTPIMRGVAYDSTTSPTGRKGHTMSMKNTVNGATTGASFGGGYGALIGAAIGLGTDLYQLRYSKKAAERANEESRRAAAEQAARSEAAANAARQWSSEQATIRRLRMAGLSPGLAYGNMSPSAAQASPDMQQVTKADTPKIDNESLLKALQLYINQQNANTASAAQASNAQLQGSQTLLNAIDSLTRGQENNARISSILASKEYTDTQKLNLIAMLIPEQQNLLANARKANADAAVIEKTGVDLAKSEIALNTAKTATEKERPAEIRQTIETQGDLAAYYRAQRNILSQRYGVDQSKIDAVADFLDMNGYSRAYLGFALDFCNDMSQHVGSDLSKQTISTIFSWLSGDNWLRYLMSKNFIPKDPLDVYEENKEYLYDGKGNKTGEVRSSHRKEYQR